MRKITRALAIKEGWYEPNERGGFCYCGCGQLTMVSQQGSRRRKWIAGEHTRYLRGHINRVVNPTKRHGLTGTPEHKSWTGMRDRCLRPSHKRYAEWGGRGITICDRWDAFEAFYADMGPKPGADYSIDRIDNDGPYSPENCRWATRSEQSLNRRPWGRR